MKNRKGDILGAGPAPRLLAAAMSAVVASGCAVAPGSGQRTIKETFASEDPCANNARNIGMAVGALAGLVIGNQIKHSNTSRLLGAAAGAAIGGFIGADMDRRRCELARIARQNKLDMQVEEIKAPPTVEPDGSPAGNGRNAPAIGLKVALKDNGLQFKSGSDELTPEAQGYFQQIADQYSYEAQKKRLTRASTQEEVAAVEALKGKRILLVGHTDDTGGSSLNADLSERRARSVARVFRERGIADEQLFFQGAGETLPVADNRTDEGRARNRRVEIVDLTDDAALRVYLAGRKPVLAYYRNVPALPGTVAASDAGGERMAGKPKAARAGSAPAGSAVADKPGPSSPRLAEAMPPPVEISAPGRDKSAVAPARAGQIDFGGAPVGTRPVKVDIGKLPSPAGGFSVISPAQADEPVVGSCLQDRPRTSHGVKSLKDGKEFATGDYLPGLYDTSWAGSANGHLVALTHVGVLRDGGVPARRPQLLVYQDYKGEANARCEESRRCYVLLRGGTSGLGCRCLGAGDASYRNDSSQPGLPRVHLSLGRHVHKPTRATRTG